MKGTSCIYVIINNINGKIYVGKTKCLISRYKQYVTYFKKPNSKRSG